MISLWQWSQHEGPAEGGWPVCSRHTRSSWSGLRTRCKEAAILEWRGVRGAGHTVCVWSNNAAQDTINTPEEIDTSVSFSSPDKDPQRLPFQKVKRRSGQHSMSTCLHLGLGLWILRSTAGGV